MNLPVGVTLADVQRALEPLGIGDDAIALFSLALTGPRVSVYRGLSPMESFVVDLVAAAKGRPVRVEYIEARLEGAGCVAECDIVSVYVCKAKRKRPDLGGYIRSLPRGCRAYLWTSPHHPAAIEAEYRRQEKI